MLWSARSAKVHPLLAALGPEPLEPQFNAESTPPRPAQAHCGDKAAYSWTAALSSALGTSTRARHCFARAFAPRGPPTASRERAASDWWGRCARRSMTRSLAVAAPYATTSTATVGLAISSSTTTSTVALGCRAGFVEPRSERRARVGGQRPIVLSASVSPALILARFVLESFRLEITGLSARAHERRAAPKRTHPDPGQAGAAPHARIRRGRRRDDDSVKRPCGTL